MLEQLKTLILRSALAGVVVLFVWQMIVFTVNDDTLLEEIQQEQEKHKDLQRQIDELKAQVADLEGVLK